jgi:hypothetical protein
MPLHVVGVHLDEAGGEEIALGIECAGKSAHSPIDGPDHAAAEHQRAVHDLVLEHEARIRDDALSSTHAASSFRIDSRRCARRQNSASEATLRAIADKSARKPSPRIGERAG